MLTVNYKNIIDLFFIGTQYQFEICRLVVVKNTKYTDILRYHIGLNMPVIRGLDSYSDIIYNHIAIDKKELFELQ